MCSSSLHNKQRFWAFVTGAVTLVSVCLLLVCSLYIVVTIQGLKLSNENYVVAERELRFTRVAAAAKHMCNGHNDTFINVDCWSVNNEHGLFNESRHDPIILAATGSYETMATNSTAFSILPLPFTKEHWIKNQRSLMYVYDILAVPTLLILICFIMCGVLFVPPYFALQRLQNVIQTRRDAMAIHNRPLESVMQQQQQQQHQAYGPDLNRFHPVMPLINQQTIPSSTQATVASTVQDNAVPSSHQQQQILTQTTIATEATPQTNNSASSFYFATQTTSTSHPLAASSNSNGNSLLSMSSLSAQNEWFSGQQQPYNPYASSMFSTSKPTQRRPFVLEKQNI